MREQSIAAMNLITACSALLFAGFSATAMADLGVGPMLLSYGAGSNVAIPYWSDGEYTVRSSRPLPVTTTRTNSDPTGSPDATRDEEPHRD